MSHQRIDLTFQDLQARAAKMANRIITHFVDGTKPSRVYGVPRGGVYAALLVNQYDAFHLVEKPEDADVIVDDIIDSGETRQRFVSQYAIPFFALVDKQGEDNKWLGSWVSFPYERMNPEEQGGAEDNVRRILQFIGENPTREGLVETPSRVVRSWGELYSGYGKDPKDVFKAFEDGACDEMVLLKNVRIDSVCEHHMLPFTGTAHVAYIPDGKIIGISKMARLVEIFARRLQVQERLTTQITGALDEHLKPLGSACVITASHACMTCRGVNKQGSLLTTSSLTGVFREKPEVRQELFSLIRMR